ncbi:helix-hairpin-helix domain-containing protein [Sphingobacterium sp. MYb382]|uniref:helix-hairpin-helix domain-containing protein n=1 Tax=Sphingobacterium sp. MYb382 TaxID=2745278 RepID=UPI0030AC61FE
MRFSIFLCALFLSFCTCLSQELSELEDILVEEIINDLDVDLDISEFTERLRFYLKHPINLNQVDEPSLNSLLFLSPVQIANILQHPKIAGPFISVLELQVVPGMDENTLDRLYPFVMVAPASPWPNFSLRKMVQESDQQIMIRYGRVLERQEGYSRTGPDETRYLGDANRYNLWYRLNDGERLSVAINAKKDAGEPFFRGKQRYGFDYYSMSLSLKNIGKIKEIVLGDYAVQVGQGLMIWNGLRLGKGTLMGNSARQGIGLKPYTSMNESNFLRGIAVRFPLAQLEATSFVSFRKVDGDLQQQDGRTVIINIQSTGLHRTATEQRYRHAVDQWLGGLVLTYQKGRLKSQMAALYTRFNGQMQPTDIMRNRYTFRGQQLLNSTATFQYSYKNLYSYGEFAQQLGGGWATNVGMLASLDPKVSFFTQYRRYQPNYYAFYAQAVSESTGVVNEQGFYSGLRYHPNRKIEWLTYIDLFRFPWLRYRVDAPSSGADFLTQFSYTWYKRGLLSLRYRHRLREENSAERVAENYLESTVKNNVRLDFRFKMGADWEIKSRLEAVRYRKNKQQNNGGLAYQELQWKPRNKSVQLNFRITSFHADAYSARLYTQEKDLLYAYSSTLLYNRGTRFYLYVAYRLSAKTQLWMRYAQSSYSEQENVGSGLDASPGRKRSDVKLQIRHQW